MGFRVPSFEQIRNSYLTALRGLQPDAPIDSDSDNFVRASAEAGVVEQLYAHQAWVARQVLPDLADVDVMERAANHRGVVRKPAQGAEGTARFSGTVGAAVPQGTLLECPGTATTTGQSQRYQTTAAAVVGGGGTVDVACAAVAPGAAGNVAGPVACTLPNPPVNVATVTLLDAEDGVDTETDASLLDRLLFDLRNPPAGGNAADYVRWAREVPGVARAFVYPLRRGDGTVDVAAFPAAGLPSGGLVAEVQSYIDARRPAGLEIGGFSVETPIGIDVDVAATITLLGGFVLADVAAAAEVAIAAYIGTLGPGETVVRTRLIALISDTPGVLDVALAEPVANVTTTVDATDLEIAQLGTVSITT